MKDSLDRAAEIGKPARALEWAMRRLAVKPRHPETLLDLSITLHNYATIGVPGIGGTRSALRSSIERARHERRAIALADSAAVASDNAADWARAVAWRAQILEYLGFQLLALDSYREIERRTTGDPDAAARAYWIEAHLKDPLLPNRIGIPGWVVGAAKRSEEGH